MSVPSAKSMVMSVSAYFDVEVATADQKVFDVKIDAGTGKVLSSQLDKNDGADEGDDE